MKSIIKRNSRSVISILLSVCMLVSCMTVSLIMTDAAQTSQQSATGAKATTDETGAMINNDTANDKGAAAKTDAVGAAAESGSTGASATDRAVGAKAGSDTVGAISYYLLMGSDNNPTTWTKNFSATRSGTTYTATIPSSDITQGSNFYLALSSSTSYTNEFNQKTNESGSDIAAANKSGSGFSWNGVTSYNYNGTTYYSAGYCCSTVISGNYTVTYNSSSRVFTVTAPSETTYAVTFNSGTGGMVVAGSTTVNAGGTASVNVGSTTATTITATPSSGYTFDKWTVSGTTSSVTLGNTTSASTTVTASDAGAIITASFKEVSTTTRTIYFDNSTANWSQPYAFAWVEGGASYLGAWPGTKMTKVKGEANVWSVEVSTDAIKIIFNDGTGTTNPKDKTEDLTIPIPTDDPTDDKDEFYNHNTSTAGQGRWKKYTKSKSSNHFEASLGTTVTGNTNLYSDINATFYDYYTDSECASSWYSDITPDEGWISDNCTRNPYTQFNTSLSEYADKNSIQFPMYFLAEYYKANGETTESYHSQQYYHEGWSGGEWDAGGFINDSNSFGKNNNDTALTGLSGKKLDGNIHHYKSGAENENGVVMAMFDPDWLTSRTGYTNNNALATIVDTKFPVRRTTKGGTVTGVTKLYVKPNGWENDNCVIDAYFFDDNDQHSWASFPDSGDLRGVDIPSWATKVIFVRRLSTTGHQTSFDSKERQSVDITLEKSGSNSKNVYTFDENWTNAKSNFTSSLDSSLDGVTTTGGQTYYTFDSTDANDNVWFTNVTSPSSGMTLEYGAGKSNGIKNGFNGTYSFLPFDGTRGIDQKGKDLGFGMKLEIDFTLGQGGKVNDMDQVFEFSGDDDLWVFIDDQLVLDLGGAHSRVEGSINFADKTLSLPNNKNIQSLMNKTSATRNTSFDIKNDDPNIVHTMTLYYMERGLHESNLKFGFSFTPVGNSFDAEEKIDTSSVNRGLQAAVENAAKNDGITVTHMTRDSASSDYTIAKEKKYTLSDGTSDPITTDSTGTYSLNKDIDATFVDQFTKGNYFKLTTENKDTNVYQYDTKLVSVTDTVTNQTKNITDGNTFEFLTTKTSPGALDATKIKAVFRSTLSTKNLIVTKNIASITDPDEEAEFTYKLYVDIDGEKKDKDYAQYPMTYTKNGTVYTLDASDGYIFKLKQNEVAIFNGIPEGALVKLEETNPGDYIFSSIAVKNSKNENVSTTEVSGSNAVTFTLSDNDTATVKNTPYNYVLTYVYTSRLWERQTYTVSGYFTKKDFYDTENTDGYVQLATVKDDTTSQECLGLKFANTPRQEVFLANNGPFEDNFRKVLKWKYDEAEVKYYDKNKQLSVTINAKEEHDEIVDIYLQIPFGIEYTSNGYKLTGDTQDGCPVKGDILKPHFTTLYETTYILNNEDLNDPIYLEVPPAIIDGGNKKYFSYWSMKDEYGVEIERCYNVKLNYVFWLEKTFATPVYESTSYDSHQMAVVDKDFATIQWLENSRNQWNMNGGGDIVKNTWKLQGDRIIADFVLSYNYQNVMLHDYANKYKTGLIIETLDELGVNETGSYYTKPNNATEGSDNYKAIYHNKAADEGKTGATTMIKIYLDSGSKTGASGNYMISEVDTATLDNKSRIEYYYTIANIKHTDGSETTRKNYVYRAYSYLYNAETKQVLLMSDPTYFTIYDIASIYCDAARGNY